MQRDDEGVIGIGDGRRREPGGARKASEEGQPFIVTVK